VPGQFKPGGGGRGTQRLYSHLEFEVFHAPFGNSDFVAPSIWDAQRWRDTDGRTVHFDVLVTDQESPIDRVVVLYRLQGSHTWQLLDLTYDPLTQIACGAAEITVPYEFLVQAVDLSGNVSLALNHGFGFNGDLWALHLPVIIKP
jgi:hypothetical protein